MIDQNTLSMEIAVPILLRLTIGRDHPQDSGAGLQAISSGFQEEIPCLSYSLNVQYAISTFPSFGCPVKPQEPTI